MLRVYLDRKLAREEAGRPDVDTQDRGRFVCGVEIPVDREVVSVRERRGKRVVRVDVRTRLKE